MFLSFFFFYADLKFWPCYAKTVGYCDQIKKKKSSTFFLGFYTQTNGGGKKLLNYGAGNKLNATLAIPAWTRGRDCEENRKRGTTTRRGKVNAAQNGTVLD